MGPEECEDIRKVLPIDDDIGGFESFTVWHMTDSKLRVMGEGVALVKDIVTHLNAEKAWKKGKIRGARRKN